MTAPQPRRTYVDHGITFDMETGQILVIPSEPWKARYPRWLKVLGFVAAFFFFVSIQPGGTPPWWVPIVSGLLGLVGVGMFFIDSMRRHPWAWQFFGTSLLSVAVFYGIRYAWHVHRAHERDEMADAIADAFAKRGMSL